MRAAIVAAVIAASGAGAARAEVTDKSASGFELKHAVRIAAPPAKVYQAITEVGRWWSPDHSYSGDAANLSVDLVKGCFCEKLKTGEVRHMGVVYHDGSRLVLAGGLGPLATTGATGHLAFAVKPSDGGAELTVTYDVGGYARGGLAEVWAGPVDGVLGEQVARLKRYVETGEPQ